MTGAPRVYIAGPDIFFYEAEKNLEQMRTICADHGLAGITPLDGEPLPDSLTKESQAKVIYQRNITLIESASALIANISPFRGVAMDPGTAFEIGFATARGIPVGAWTEDTREYLVRVSGAYGGHLRKGEDEHWRDPSGIEVEDFGLPENLMIAVPALAKNAHIAHSFEEAVRLAARNFT